MGRKRLLYQTQWSEDGLLDTSTPSHTASRRVRQNSSSESLAPLPHSDRERRRQVSGTLSETSQSSSGARGVTFRRADDSTRIMEERLVFITSNKVPFCVTSCLGFHKSSKTTRRSSQSKLNLREVPLSRRHRTTSGSRPLPAINDSFDAFELLGLERTDSQEVSYCQLLQPAYTCKEVEPRSGQPPFPDLQDQEGRASPKQSVTGVEAAGHRSLTSQISDKSLPGEEQPTWGQSLCPPYFPDTLDGWLGSGKHRTFLPFPSYITSVIEYVKPSDLKKELNEKFLERFPGVQLSLSKLRSIKLEMRRIGHECDVDNTSIAQAYVYFEKLVLKKVINKDNRKFCAGASLILSAKLNDVKGEQLKSVIERTEAVFRLNRRDLLASEFAILVCLEFSLHVPAREVLTHYQRLLYHT